jgi:hypothetical protein
VRLQERTATNGGKTRRVVLLFTQARPSIPKGIMLVLDGRIRKTIRWQRGSLAARASLIGRSQLRIRRQRCSRFGKSEGSRSPIQVSRSARRCPSFDEKKPTHPPKATHDHRLDHHQGL